MKLTRFTGINNVVPEERLAPTDKGSTALVEATNVDIGLAGELMMRQGHAQASSSAHSWVWEADGFTLAVVAGDLVAIAGNTVTTLLADVGTDRMWYCNWPDGRTAFTNGTVAGLARADSATGWGIENAADGAVGTATASSGGALPAGAYMWGITYVRDADGLESGLTPITNPLTLTVDQQIDWTALPILDGYSINVYLTHHNGSTYYLAGNTATDALNFDGGVQSLVGGVMDPDVNPAPAGRLPAFWRGCALVADGPILWRSKYLRPEHFDLEDGYYAFSGDITLVQPVEGGIFVGTTKELAFLRGTNALELAYEQVVAAACVLGSGATVPGKWVKRGDTNAEKGTCMLGIVDGAICAGYPDGGFATLTQGVYRTAASQVCATFRLRGDIPQYVALPVT